MNIEYIIDNEVEAWTESCAQDRFSTLEVHCICTECNDLYVELNKDDVCLCEECRLNFKEVWNAR